MGIYDKALEVAVNQDLSGAAPSGSPYEIGNASITMTTLSDVIDPGHGGSLWMEFEVTETFTATSPTGGSFGPLVAAQQPYLLMGAMVAPSANPVGSVQDFSAVSWAGFPVSGASLYRELGLQSSSSTGASNLRQNLIEGDRYYCALPGGGSGVPWLGAPATGVRDETTLTQALGFVGAVFLLPNRTGTLVNPLNTAAYTASDFTAGRITARIVQMQPTDPSPNYTAGFTVA